MEVCVVCLCLFYCLFIIVLVGVGVFVCLCRLDVAKIIISGLFCFFSLIYINIFIYMPFLYVQSNSTPLLVAAEKGHKEVVTVLLERGANMNVVNKVVCLCVCVYVRVSLYVFACQLLLAAFYIVSVN